MSTTLILIVILAVILAVIGEVWGSDNGGRFWNPFQISFPTKLAQFVYRLVWVVLIIALCADVITMLNFSGYGWLWLIIILPAVVVGLFIFVVLFIMAMVWLFNRLTKLLNNL